MNEIFHYFKFKNLSKNWWKYVFHREKLNFETIGNSVHTAEFWALGKAWIFMSSLNLYGMKALQVLRLHSTMISLWIGKLNYVKFNIFSVIINNFGHVIICWWVTLFVRLNYWGQVLEMNFSSNNINFDKLLKFVSFLASCVIYNKNTLLMMCYHTGIYFPELKIWEIHKNSLKYKILETATRGVQQSEAAIKKVP